MEERKTLEFGRKYQVGNFRVLKYNRVLRKSEVSELRNQMGIPMDMRKNLQRSQLPYIKVMAVSGIWAVEYCCNTMMFRFIDEMLSAALKAEEDGVRLESNSVADFAFMFSMMFTDTTVMGDSVYLADKGNALKAFMERQKAVEVSEEQEKATLEDLEADENAKATIIDMAGKMKEGGGDDGK